MDSPMPLVIRRQDASEVNDLRFLSGACLPASLISMQQQCDIINISLITGNSLAAGKCLTKTRLIRQKNYRS